MLLRKAKIGCALSKKKKLLSDDTLGINELTLLFLLHQFRTDLPMCNEDAECPRSHKRTPPFLFQCPLRDLVI